jgi:hypothetical protein
MSPKTFSEKLAHDPRKSKNTLALPANLPKFFIYLFDDFL